MGDGNEDVDIHDHPLAVASNEVNYYFISVCTQEEVCSAKTNSHEKGVRFMDLTRLDMGKKTVGQLLCVLFKQFLSS